MAEKVKEYCAFIHDRLDQMTFEQKCEVLEALRAEFTLEKDGKLRILLVLPPSADISLCTNVRRASGYTAHGRMQDGILVTCVIRLAWRLRSAQRPRPL